MKSLQEMTLEELWQLFPIELQPHQSHWGNYAREEIEALHLLLDKFSPVINHIGSTAIPGIMGKPIVDILVEVAPEVSLSTIMSIMTAHGYICMNSTSARMSFNKGYTPRGYADRVFHIHVRLIGDNDEIFFRDYLIAHPETAREYEQLKLHLAHQFKHDRDRYTSGKDTFVANVLSHKR